MTSQRIELPCPRCGTRLSFDAAQAGASGPCYACGQTIVVPHAAPPQQMPQQQMPPQQMPPQQMPPQSMPPQAPQSMAPRPANQELEVRPQLQHHNAAESVAKEAAKSGMQVLGTRVLQIGQAVGRGENFGAALWGGQIRVDHAQAIKLRSPQGDFFVFIPWSGNMRLAHEMASIVPRGLPSCLRLSRGLLGAWSSGRYEGSNGGENDPIAKAAEPEYDLHDNIQWDWESGRMRIKLHWGLQAVPFDSPAVGPRTLHVMHTAEIGIVFRDFGLKWYLDRRLAFAKFVQKHQSDVRPRLEWNPPPIAALFLDDLAS